MPHSEDTALEVALEQRRELLEAAQLELAARERVVQAEAERLREYQRRTALVLDQVVRQHAVPAGRSLDVPVLSDLDAQLRRCERDAATQEARLSAARAAADEVRGAVVTAHQRVRALELVLEARAAERAERQRRAEVREADEVAARVHGAHRRLRAG